MAAACEGALEMNKEVERVILTLSTLVKPPEAGDAISNISSSIENNLSKAIALCGKEKIYEWLEEQNVFKFSLSGSVQSSWKFICICLSSILHLKDIMTQSGKEVLLSVNQKTTIRATIQFVSAIGISPFFKPSVGLSVQNRCRSSIVSPTFDNELSELEKYNRLAIVIRVLTKLLDDKSWDLYGVILSSSIMDLVPALIQLSWSPPVLGSTKEEYENSVREFRQIAKKTLESIHQPTVIRELMLCLSTNPSKQSPPPAWFIRACSKLLTQCLLSPRGVISTVRALHDLGDITDNQRKQYSSTAKLLLGPHGPKHDVYYLYLCPQLLELLRSDNNEYQNVAVHTVQLLWAKNKELCIQQILQPLWQPLCSDFGELEGNLVLESSQEQELSSSVLALLAITSPAGVPVDALLPCLHHICNFHLATRHKGGTPQLRNNTKDLLARIMTNTESEEAWKIIFGLPEDCILNLANESAIANSIFLNLLHSLHKTTELDEKVTYCKLLMSIAEIPSVQKHSLQKPNVMLISTIKSFLEDSDSEMIPVALLLLGTMISECEDWAQYQNLVPALQKLRQSIELTESLRAVAEEIIATISTLGAVGMNVPTTCKKEKVLNSNLPENKTTSTIPKSPSSSTASPGQITFEEAILETKDSEIPTQGHGFLALTKLIKSKDAKTVDARDEVFALCLTGLQHEDSYVYLAAVGALSALTLSNLIDLLPKVTENYCRTQHGPTLRTRLGETLLQVCKGLGEMAGVHRLTLLNAFLAGAKDASPAVRASSLSNLGEACRVLGFQVSGQLHEILVCAHSVATSDPELEVRRAAVMLTSLLLRGLGSQAVPLLGSAALEVYRGLKQLALSPDHILSLQAQLALEELSHGIKEGVLTPQPMEKKIYITSPPP